MRFQFIRVQAVLRATCIALACLLLIGLSTYGYVYRDRLFPLKNTVVVYGRETCSITKNVRRDLEQKRVSYVFANADVPAISDEMWYKLGPEFKEKSIVFPIVHVAGKVLLTPTGDQIAEELSRYMSSSTQVPERDFSTLLNGADPVPRY